MGRGALPTSLVQALLLLAWSRIRQKSRQRQVICPVELDALHLKRNKPKFRQRIKLSHPSEAVSCRLRLDLRWGCSASSQPFESAGSL